MAQKIWEEKAERDDCATGFVPKSSTVAFIAEFGIPHLQNPGIESCWLGVEEYVQIADLKQTRSAPSPVWSPFVVVS